VKDLVQRLKRSAERESSEKKQSSMGDLLTGRKNQLNALALIGMFSLSSFCYYLISFYMADSPGDKYLNFAYVGLGDAFAAFFTKKL